MACSALFIIYSGFGIVCMGVSGRVLILVVVFPEHKHGSVWVGIGHGDVWVAWLVEFPLDVVHVWVGCWGSSLVFAHLIQLLAPSSF